MVSLRALASLATAVKLSLGFGVVLVLTLVVAATGFFALRDVGARFSLLERFSDINDKVAQMRRTEQAFIISGDAAQTQRLHEQAQALREQVQQLRDQVAGDERDALQQVDGDIAEYVQVFDRYVEQSDNMRLSLDAAKWLVVGAANSLDLLKDGLAEDGIYALKESQGNEGGESVTQAGQIGKVHILLLQALEQARVLLENSRASGEVPSTNIQEALDAQAQAAQLRDALGDPGYRSVLAEVVGNIDSFNQRLQEYTGLLQQQQQEHAKLAERADKVVELVSQTYAQQKGAVHTLVRTSALLILVAAAAALLVGLLATLIITRAIVRPLKQVTAVAQRIAAGDLSGEIEVQRSDEIGQLLGAMQGMSRDLRTMVGRLQDGVAQLSTSAQTLSSVTEQARQGVSGQKEETDLVATAITQMAATVHEVAQNAEQAAASTAQADSRVGAGSDVVRETLQRIEQLVAAMAVTRQGIEQLSQDTRNIDAVLEVIKSVAQQTNLLALNAAIEAARAGEQGRGFAVVADEVRALARRTQQSTEEIEGLLGTLRAGATRSVADMRQSDELVEQVVHDARHTQQALAGIAEAVAVIHGMNQQIAAAAEQQTAVAEDINRSVTSIRDLGEQSAAAMDENAGSSQQLAALGRELQGMAAHFRL
ncbi:methyl-accepting chemotaxis protein [Pseudomonas sp. PA27(2017)]|uniref:methyl-accepting chemotaxis protein n=1 Tax=Pseudomonas sp. PA27(2017) TaxID=1932112 RepID=UPI00096375D3|nr:methyl-accepting chemotaxis protein [Pseudomonas sp. PA27(2017)]OLU35922.1 methyl-accepting chemotaxis protein [Pseudomonas sp. PA27(2017)]